MAWGTMLKDVRAFDIFYGMLQSLCLVCRFSTWGVQALGFVFGWLNGLRVIMPLGFVFSLR